VPVSEMSLTFSASKYRELQNKDKNSDDTKTIFDYQQTNLVIHDG
jgi:hypothetical protein